MTDSTCAAVVLLAEMKCGELLNQMPKVGVGGNGSNQYKTAIIPDTRNNSTGDSPDDEEELKTPKAKLEVAKELGFSKDQVSLSPRPP